MLLMTHWAGCRVGEVAALKCGDVIGKGGEIKPEIRLTAEQTKGRHARVVYVSERLRREIATYLAGIDTADLTLPLFATQKRQGFSANTACGTLNAIYREAGISGASSHSGRRSFITTLSGKGIGVRVLAALAGHRSLSSILPYIDASDDQKRAAVELVG
jgi:integrase/recombinase XerD